MLSQQTTASNKHFFYTGMVAVGERLRLWRRSKTSIMFSREETGKVGAINHGVSIAERPRSVDTEAALLPHAVTTF